MTKYFALAVATKYWKPGTNYLNEIAQALQGKVEDGDFVVVSEKALCTALGRTLDESDFTPYGNAKFIAKFWMRFIWGYGLGFLCHFGRRLLRRVRQYPLEEGSRHKQVSLIYGGILQALMFGSEGGIDGSNLPYSYVSLPLDNADVLAIEIRRQIRRILRKEVTAIIVDTDKTYSFMNFHFTPRPKPMKGIYSQGGIGLYVAGRMLRLRKRPTPLAVSGCPIQAEEALKIANIADRARGPGSGATVWDMAARFKVAMTNVTWKMLTQIKHHPIVIVRKKQNRQHDSYNRKC